ncbi:D-arabinono-1,4-lactone oxidase [Cellulomonas soli]|uniref:L-gulonolactone oxidase n=1 Tax=Cellulomonas soli TaxID=931535 RepID=A0A512PEW2_9CELL|nr:D-arabinono-1,4-lactone oxidase [Cellulomonas soli]NYI59469.1 FAD-linked oxidoreductase [Cellulomonas soli]GEP69739.1 L-gulonolactone oxidase [Cellulomonas soli]
MGRRSVAAHWENWSRTESASPTHVAHPEDEDALRTLVRQADGRRVRAVGGGHSFTGAAVTDGIQVHLDALADVQQVDVRPDGTAHVTVGAGIRLARLNAELGRRGLAMRNLGDIDKQSIAGAISTGTHGTGAGLGGLCTQVVGARLVTAAGEVLETSPTQHSELFEVARLGLGSVGLLAAVTLEVVPAFRLQAREEPWALDAVLEQLDGPDGLVEANDHFEFYWFPHTRGALTKRNNRVPDSVVEPLSRTRAWVDDELLSNGVFGLTNRFTTLVPAATPQVNRIATRALSARRYTAPSHEVFVSPRRVRFREMEYAVPREHLVDVLAAIDAWITASGTYVPFPVEVRFAAADDVWLSTAHGRATAYVAVHQYLRLPHVRYFDAVERIVAQVDGRPHWGKLHGLDATRLAELYPRFADVRRVRTSADPDGMFRNDYLDRVLATNE